VDFASTSFVLGYHGCSLNLAQRVVAGKDILHASHNDYDWLGDGIYFWEHNASRAFEFATESAIRKRRSMRSAPKIAVVGAVIDLGFCLNLLDSRFIQIAVLSKLYGVLTMNSFSSASRANRPCRAILAATIY